LEYEANVKQVQLRGACNDASDVRTWSLYDKNGFLQNIPIDDAKQESISVIEFTETGTFNVSN